MHVAIDAGVPTRVDRVRGPGHLLGHGNVRGGKPDGPAALVASSHDPSHFVGTAEHCRCRRHVATGERAADGGGTHRLSGAAVVADELQAVDLEAQPLAHRTQPIDVALAVTAEMEVLTNDDRSRMQRIGKDLPHEVVGAGE